MGGVRGGSTPSPLGCVTDGRRLIKLTASLLKGTMSCTGAPIVLVHVTLIAQVAPISLQGVDLSLQAVDVPQSADPIEAISADTSHEGDTEFPIVALANVTNRRIITRR